MLKQRLVVVAILLIRMEVQEVAVQKFITLAEMALLAKGIMEEWEVM